MSMRSREAARSRRRSEQAVAGTGRRRRFPEAPIAKQKVPGRVERCAAVRTHMARMVTQSSGVARSLRREGCLTRCEIVSAGADLKSTHPVSERIDPQPYFSVVDIASCGNLLEIFPPLQTQIMQYCLLRFIFLGRNFHLISRALGAGSRGPRLPSPLARPGLPRCARPPISDGARPSRLLIGPFASSIP
eukprot:g23073.t1